jgi:hypothetical protein
MPLFGSARDASFLRSISKEIINKIISVEVAIYKLSLADTDTNIYGEARSKAYYHPVRVSCLIRKEDKTEAGDDFGLDYQKMISFAFLRDTLKDINLVIDEGDIINWDGGYYHVDNVKGTNYWMTRNPDTLIPYNENEVPEFGYSVSIVVDAHLTTSPVLDIVDKRSGIDNGNRLPRDL